MPVVCEKSKTVYFPIPKVACTSLKIFFWQVNNGRPLPIKPGLLNALRHRLGWRVPKIQVQALDGYRTEDFDPGITVAEGFETVVLVRDPVRRFKSAWSNKVNQAIFRQHGELATIRDAGLPLDPTFGEFLENFSAYARVSRPVRRHTSNMVRYLGDDIRRFDRVFKLEDMPRFEQYLSDRLGHSVRIPRENRSSATSRDAALSDHHREILAALTADDYRLLEGYYQFAEAITTI